MSKGYMYILECADGSYYTGSTKDLERRLAQHQAGEGANHTKKRLPVKLVYFEEFQRIDEAFYREKQVQGWGRKKKEALINGDFDKLSHLAKNYTQYPRDVASASSASKESTSSASRQSGFDKLSPQEEPQLPEPQLPEPQLPEPQLPEPAEGNDHKNNLKGLRYE